MSFLKEEGRGGTNFLLIAYSQFYIMFIISYKLLLLIIITIAIIFYSLLSLLSL